MTEGMRPAVCSLLFALAACSALAGPPVFPGQKIPAPEFEKPKQEVPKDQFPISPKKEKEPFFKFPVKKKRPDLVVTSFAMHANGKIIDGQREVVGQVAIKNSGNAATDKTAVSIGLMKAEVLSSSDPQTPVGSVLYKTNVLEKAIHPLSIEDAKTNPNPSFSGVTMTIPLGVTQCRITYVTDGVVSPLAATEALVQQDKKAHPDGNIMELSEANNSSQPQIVTFP